MEKFDIFEWLERQGQDPFDDFSDDHGQVMFRVVVKGFDEETIKCLRKSYGWSQEDIDEVKEISEEFKKVRNLWEMFYPPGQG